VNSVEADDQTTTATTPEDDVVVTTSRHVTFFVADSADGYGAPEVDQVSIL
jgi:hypothetical protein